MTPSVSPRILSRICLNADSVQSDFGQKPRAFWIEVIKVAHDQKVLPALHGALTKQDVSVVPSDLMDYLRLEVRKIRVKNLKVRAELFQLSSTLALSRIPHIIFKGVPLAELGYGGIGLREFNDNDLIVRFSDIDDVAAILKSLGYISIIPENAVGRYKKHHFDKEICLVKRNGNQIEQEADVHWMLLKPSFDTRVDYQSLEEYIEYADINGVSIPVLNAYADFVALCVHHGINEGWSKLKYLFDLHHATFRLDTPDSWSKMFELAGQFNITSVVNATVLLLVKHTGTHIPDHIVEQARQDIVASSLIKAHTFSNQESHWNVLQRKLRMKSGTKRSKVLLSHFRELAAPNHADQEFVSVPNAENYYWFYFLIKPLRLLVKGENRDAFQ